MTVVDWIIIVVLALAAFGGFRQGFIVEVATILGALLALAVARAEYTSFRHVLAQFAPHSAWITVISYLAIFLLVWGGIVLLARRLRWFVRLLLLGWADRLGGAVIGLLQGVIVVELLLYLGQRVPDHSVRHAINHASLTPTFLHIVPYLHQLFPHVNVAGF